jgi:hypothetical protein
MAGAVSGLIGSLKTAAAVVVNKYFELSGTVNPNAYAGEQARDVVSDSFGNVYFISGLYVYKYSKDGTFQWSKSHGGAQPYMGGCLATDSTYVYVSVVDSGYQAVVSALDIATGNWVWTKTTGTSTIYQSYPAPIAVFNSTQLVVGLSHFPQNGKDSPFSYPVIINKSDGSMAYNGTLGVDQTELVYGDPSGNLWIATTQQLFKFNSSLVKQAVYSTGTLTGFKIDSSGNLYFSSGTVTAKYNSSLALQWQKSIVVPSAYAWNWSNNSTMDVDSSGNVYIIPGFERQQFGTTYKAPVVKLTSTGATSWIKIFSNGSNSLASFESALRLTSSGDLLTNISSNLSLSKLKTDGVSWTSGALSWSDYASATITNTTFNFVATTTSGYGNSWSTTAPGYGWSNHSGTQTSGTSITPSYIYT